MAIGSRRIAYWWVSWITLALVLALGGLVFARRPGHPTLRVEGMPGTKYLGSVSIDGVKRPLSGDVPGDFQFTGHRIEVIVISRDGDDQSFKVDLDGTFVGNRWGAEGAYVMDWGFPHWSLQSLPEDAWKLHRAEFAPEAAERPDPEKQR